MKRFSKYIGIDYSGAKTPDSRLAGLRIFSATAMAEPIEVDTSIGDGTYAKHMRWNWSRKEVAFWLRKELAEAVPVVVGIDHGFSFPESYFKRYGINTWDDFLDDFVKHWPTDQDGIYVDFIRKEKPQRTGRSNEFRLTEKRARGTQSVFKMDGQGTVGKSTHTGIPWIRRLRRDPDLAGRLHFWPFDGFEVKPGRSVIAEVWPTLFRQRYPRPDGRTRDQHDAYSVAKWFQRADEGGQLEQCFALESVNLDPGIIQREGWILGVV